MVTQVLLEEVSFSGTAAQRKNETKCKNNRSVYVKRIELNAVL